MEQVGWQRNEGYLAKVVYSDGYSEMIQVQNLKRKNNKIENFERCSGIRVWSGEPKVELDRTGKLWVFDKTNETNEQQRRREAGLMHERYIGVAFEKSFGECGMFLGVVQEVWRHEDFFFLLAYFMRRMRMLMTCQLWS